MFDLCYSNGANLNLLNRQNLSPLNLAAKLRRVNVRNHLDVSCSSLNSHETHMSVNWQMFFHIITIQRQVSWIFCDVGFLEMPLNGVDSINTESGACNDDSVLSIVVFGVSVYSRANLYKAIRAAHLTFLQKLRTQTSTCRCWMVC